MSDAAIALVNVALYRREALNQFYRDSKYSERVSSRLSLPLTAENHRIKTTSKLHPELLLRTVKISVQVECKRCFLWQVAGDTQRLQWACAEYKIYTYLSGLIDVHCGNIYYLCPIEDPVVLSFTCSSPIFLCVTRDGWKIHATEQICPQDIKYAIWCSLL